jgi:8-oxo-dGTP pyrophosphatase MutT (NUDIX family)
MQVKQQTSAGGVVYRRTPALEICLINPVGRTLWALPKGAIEPGESYEEAAIREIREETGMEGAADRFLGAIEYSFYSRTDQRRIHKVVHFFLVRAVGGDTSRHDHEVGEARWLPLAGALDIMSYPNERLLVRTAADLLGEPPSD